MESKILSNDKETEESIKKRKIVKRIKLVEKFIKEYKNVLPMLLQHNIAKKSLTEVDVLHNFLISNNSLTRYNHEFNTTKKFIYDCLENYELMELTKDESDILKKTYFNNINLNEKIDEKEFEFIENSFINTSVLENNILYNENNKNTFNSILEEEVSSKINEEHNNDFEKSDNDEKTDNDDNDDKNTKINSFLLDDFKINKESDKIDELEEKENFKNNITSKKINIKKTSSDYISDIKNKKKSNTNSKQSELLKTDKHFFDMQRNEIEVSKIKKKKEYKKIKKQIESFFNNLNCDELDKKAEIINFIKEKNKDINVDIFYKKYDYENIITSEDINNWYEIIKNFKKKEKNVFDLSSLILFFITWVIENFAKMLKIKELEDLTSEINIKDFPSDLFNTKNNIENTIYEFLPEKMNFVYDYALFICKIYLKKRFNIIF